MSHPAAQIFRSDNALTSAGAASFFRGRSVTQYVTHRLIELSQQGGTESQVFLQERPGLSGGGPFSSPPPGVLAGRGGGRGEAEQAIGERSGRKRCCPRRTGGQSGELPFSMAKTNIPELLAPAGDWPCLDAALDAGADAVYFGVKGFNMRAGARNFSTSDLPKVVAKVQGAGARAYLTLNVVVRERDLASIRRVLRAARAAEIDGVIAADFAVLAAAREEGLPVHASTQMSVANSTAMRFLLGQGIRRFVLARECSLADIRRIKKAVMPGTRSGNPKVQIEAFAHGAMCVSMSGRCFLSYFESGKSANCGECIQPCRREYRIVEEREGQEWVVGKDYILSPADLCTLPFLERLIAAGVDSLKIEGRNRSPEYVSTVVGAYRKALDFYAEEKGTRSFGARWKTLKAELQAQIGRVYHRGFSSGFYFGRPIGRWQQTPRNQAPLKKCFVGTVTNYFRRPGVAEVQVQSDAFRLGDELLFEGRKTGFFRQKVESLRRDDGPVSEALQGCCVSLQVAEPVRRGDKAYVMRPRAGS